MMGYKPLPLGRQGSEGTYTRLVDLGSNPALDFSPIITTMSSIIASKIQSQMKYKRAAHAVYDCRYHLVWITKYRNDCINEKMKERLETVIR